MQLDECLWLISNLHTSLESLFCSERGVFLETAFVPNTVNVSKPRQKHEILQCTKM